MSAPANRDMSREHAPGEAMTGITLEKVARYEIHLDRKLERTFGHAAEAQGPVLRVFRRLPSRNTRQVSDYP